MLIASFGDTTSDVCNVVTNPITNGALSALQSLFHGVDGFGDEGCSLSNIAACGSSTAGSAGAPAEPTPQDNSITNAYNSFNKTCQQYQSSLRPPPPPTRRYPAGSIGFQHPSKHTWYIYAPSSVSGMFHGLGDFGAEPPPGYAKVGEEFSLPAGVSNGGPLTIHWYEKWQVWAAIGGGVVGLWVLKSFLR